MAREPRHEHVYLSADRRYVGVRRTRRNDDYELLGSQYAHVVIWRSHHGVFIDPEKYIIHHKDHNKRHNGVCDNDSGHCPVWDCGNLAALSRADHIREHRPGRMGGRRIPNRVPRRRYSCEVCGREKSRNGTRCRRCYLADPTLA